jgi:hypothetical protein
MKEFRTSIFVKTKERTRKQMLYNLTIFGSIAGIWALYIFGFPLVGLKTAITITVTLIGMKLYDDKYKGISAYGERKQTILIAEEYLEAENVRIPYSELTNLVIYVNEYLGMSKEFFGIHHGGNNEIAFEHNGKAVSFLFVIKNEDDFKRVESLVHRIENNPALQKNLRVLS